MICKYSYSLQILTQSVGWFNAYLPLDPEYHQGQGTPNFSYMYGAEYENTDGL